ncbi:sugar kinase [Gelidibacter maritimus]|uniref:Sugar kinase n=2 Tax=Gelidibacter maritimus TaxID=2761487 RepID=A0A7W2R4M1_9FLAO|nr:sugar kinase [Gelidibacter maritimus]MBA6154046.1 sugar kinase [Gelidibacter maritimus]
MQKIVTFGEIMLRLSTEDHLRFSQANSFKVNYGGGEFNVAVSLSNYGFPSEFVTRLPNNDIGQSALMEIRRQNVSAENIIYGGERLGIYFLETGAGLRGSKVVYDRNHSGISDVEIGVIDWKKVFQDASVFHWSGLTPAISQNAADVCLEAVKVAKGMGVLITTDLNYRAKLWKYGKAPKDIMPELLKYSNVILGDLDTAFMMIGKDKVNPNYKDADSLPQFYDLFFDQYPDLKYMATTLRYSRSASHQQIGGIFYDKEKLYTATVREITPVVDRVGSGDAFMGGIIYGLVLDTFDPQYTINFAVAACCLKHTISGDYNLATKEEVEALVKGGPSGIVSR